MIIHKLAFILLKGKQATILAHNMLSDYFYLTTDSLMKMRQKVVRLWPHLLYRLLFSWFVHAFVYNITMGKCDWWMIAISNWLLASRDPYFLS